MTSLRGYWPPFASLASRAADQLTIVRGQGATVWDAAGTAYLDATASLWYANLGYGRTEIGDAVRAQLDTLAAYSNFGVFATEPTLRLTERVAALAPLDDPLVFLTSGGSDAVDSAVKIARRYWSLTGRPEKTTIVSRDCSYHGMHGFGTAIAGIPANAAGYGPRDETAFVRVATNDPTDLEKRILDHGPETVAAVFVEPVVGAGGVIPPAPGYLAAVRELCDRHDLLMVADEVVTGFGRLGAWFGCERYEVQPDLLLMAKGITAGYLPLGGVVAARRVWDAFRASGSAFRHGYTYSGHAAACVAALTVLDILDREGLLARVRELEPVLAAALDPLRSLAAVVEVRHAGLLGAVQFVDTPDTQVDRVVAGLRARGVLTRALPGNAIQLSPPFVITAAEIDRIAESIAAVAADPLSR